MSLTDNFCWLSRWPFGVEVASSHHVWLGYLWVLQFPPTVQSEYEWFDLLLTNVLSRLYSLPLPIVCWRLTPTDPGDTVRYKEGKIVDGWMDDGWTVAFPFLTFIFVSIPSGSQTVKMLSLAVIWTQSYTELACPHLKWMCIYNCVFTHCCRSTTASQYMHHHWRHSHSQHQLTQNNLITSFMYLHLYLPGHCDHCSAFTRLCSKKLFYTSCSEIPFSSKHYTVDTGVNCALQRNDH